MDNKFTPVRHELWTLIQVAPLIGIRCAIGVGFDATLNFVYPPLALWRAQRILVKAGLDQRCTDRKP